MLFFDNIQLFNSAVVNKKKYKCPFCIKSFPKIELLYNHVGSFHKDKLTSDKSVKQTVYDEMHPGDHLCQICHVNKCVWIEKTGHYSTLCANPSCREEARRRFQKNYKQKYGKERTLDDPEEIREMLKKKKNSGIYKFTDGGTLSYISSYEKDFLEFYDKVLEQASSSITECDIVFKYRYENKDHLYLPDYYIKEYDLIIEIKADEDISHPKILAVDKETERLKDLAVKKDGTHNFIKIVDKDYEPFYNLYNLLKNNYLSNPYTKDKIIIIPKRKETIKGFNMPKLNFVYSDKIMTESYIMRKVLDSVKGVLNLSLVVNKNNLPEEFRKEDEFKTNPILVMKTYSCDFKDVNVVNRVFNEFKYYYTKHNEKFIRQDFESIYMDISTIVNKFSFRIITGLDNKHEKQFLEFYSNILIDQNIINYTFFNTCSGILLIYENKNNVDISGLTEYIQNNKLNIEIESPSDLVPLPGSVDAGVNIDIIKI